MKKIKLLAAIATIATTSCVAASTALADNYVFELDAVKTTDTSKVVNLYFETDMKFVEGVTYMDIDFGGLGEDKITYKSSLTNPVLYVDDLTREGCVTFGTDTGYYEVDNGKILLATFTVETSEDLSVMTEVNSIALKGSSGDDTRTPENLSGAISIVDATDLGTFAAGEGVPVKAFTVGAAVDGDYTWNVTDGINAAKSETISVTGGADVVLGLRVAGANAGKVSYAAVTID